MHGMDQITINHNLYFTHLHRGFNEKRQLGLSHRFNQETPVLISHLAHIKIVKVKCGQQHSLALSEDGHVYSWGLGVLGQLGHGECRDAGVPTKIEDIPLIQGI
jgi:alpha-tubulin suppressor-like RCC1 family protein